MKKVGLLVLLLIIVAGVGIIVLNLPPSSKKSDLENAMHGYILAQTVLTGRYQRQ